MANISSFNMVMGGLSAANISTLLGNFQTAQSTFNLVGNVTQPVQLIQDFNPNLLVLTTTKPNTSANWSGYDTYCVEELATWIQAGIAP